METTLWMVALLAACGGSAPPPQDPTPPTSDRTPEGMKARAAQLREKACNCVGAACATTVRDELASWQASVGTPMSSDPAIDAQLKEQVAAIKMCLAQDGPKENP